MADRAGWLTRLVVAGGLILGYAAALAVGAVAYLSTKPTPGSTLYAVVDYGGSLLVCLVGPATGFWAARRLRGDAKQTSWLALIPVAAAELVLWWVSESFATEIEYEWPRWTMPTAAIAAPVAGAILGMFIPAGLITVGRTEEHNGGTRIT